MSGMPLTDAQLVAGLTRQSPRAAPDGLRERILAEAEATPQLRPLPAPLSRLADADPIARRRALLLVAAALLILGLVAAGVVGAYLESRRVIPDLALAPPADLPTFVRSTYDLMPELEPMTISFIDGANKGRIYVDASGAIRTERFASPGDKEPETYRILRGTTTGEVVMVDGRRVWYEQEDAIGEDPRVFVFAALGAARTGVAPGCEVAVSPGEVYVAEPGRNWVYVGLEQVAGRPTHHVRCGDDLWIDVETRVTLRSRGKAIGVDGQADPAGSRTIEATEVVLGQPPAHLFELRPPDGVAAITPEEYACAQDPYCSASPKPVVTPAPAPADTTLADLDTVLAAALAASDVPAAYDVMVERWSAKYPGSTTRTVHDGAGRYRLETRFDGSPDPASIMLVGEDYHYATESTTDGFIFWRDTSSQLPTERRVGYPLRLPPECVGGWQQIGVDLVHGRVADHVTCPGVLAPDEYWIDRETHLVLRIQTLYDEAQGTTVEEVVELSFDPPPPALFELPEGADVRQ